MIWAINEEAPFIRDGHIGKFGDYPADHGAFLITMQPQVGVIKVSDRTYNTNFYLAHGWVLWFAWGPLGLVQIMSGRYFRVWWKVNMWMHIISGVSVMLLTYLYVFLAIKEKNWVIGASFHDVLGMIDLILIGVLDA